MENFDFRVIQKEFDEVLNITENKIDRNWSITYPRLENGRFLVLTYFQLAKNYHNTIVSLCENTKHPLFSLSTVPLVRTILEILHTLIYFFDDVPETTKILSITVYREQVRDIDALERNSKGIIEREQEIKEKKVILSQAKRAFENDFGSKAFSKIDWEIDWTKSKEARFPTLRVIRDSFKDRSPELHNFLQFLDDSLYRELSIFSHSEPFGLVQISPMLLGNNPERLQEIKNKNLWLSLTLMMCITSEIEIALNFGLKNELNHIWKVFINLSSTPKEIYELRYRKLLN